MKNWLAQAADTEVPFTPYLTKK